MRIVSAATCSALIALAAWRVLQWSRTIWPLVGVLVAVTPVSVYSGSTPAPNGPEMFAGLALWSALVGLRRVAPTDLAARRLLVAAIVPTALLAAARTLGPVWLLLIAATILPLVGPHKLWVLVRAWPRTTALTVGVGLTATAGALAWTLMVGAQRIVGGYDRGLPDPFTSSLKLVPWWLLQSIAAFPDKVDPAPGPVYGSAGLLLSLVLLLGLRQGTLLLRLVTLGTVVVSLTVPTVLSAATYSALGPIWQGRYGLPYAMGIALVASIALDERPPPKRVPAALALSAWSILLFIEHLAGALHVLQRELVDSPLSGSTSWLLPNPWLLVVLVLAASVSWASAIRVWRPAPSSCVVGCARTNVLPRAIPKSDVPQVTE